MKFLDASMLPAYERMLQQRDLISRARAVVRSRGEELPLKPLTARLLFFANEVATGKPCNSLRTEPAVMQYVGFTTYQAPAPDLVCVELEKLMAQVWHAMPGRIQSHQTKVMIKAAQLHLAILCIHPFSDGNGRTARLLERWFVAMHFGPWAFGIHNERYYREHRVEYLTNLHVMGTTWKSLDLSRSLNFLQMLPAAIDHQLNT